MIQRRRSLPRRARFGLSILLLAALPAEGAGAETVPSGDPFAGLDAIRLTAEIGGPLDPQGDTAPRLFAGELRRFNQFTVDLKQAVAAKLGTCGILVDDGAPDELTVEVFGRRDDLQQCSPLYVYMVQARVLNTTLTSRQAEPRFVPFYPVIGVADEAGLERTLIDTAVATVAGQLRNCGR
jgi:hypothetical protein